MAKKKDVFEYEILDEEPESDFDYEVIEEEGPPTIPQQPSRFEPGSIFKSEFMPKFQKEEPSSTLPAGIPYEAGKELSPQYTAIFEEAKKQTDPDAIANIVSRIPEIEREKVIPQFPQEYQEKIRSQAKLFERAHPELGVLAKTVGAGVKESANIVHPSYDPFNNKAFQDQFGSIVIGDGGKEKKVFAKPEELKSVADKYRDDQGRIDVSKAPREEPRVRPFLEAVKRFEENPAKKKKMEAVGENLIGFGEYLDPVEIKAYKINERIEALKKNNPDYGAALERGSLKMAIEKAIGDFTVSGNEESTKQFIELNKKYEEAIAADPEKKKGLLKTLLISSIEMFPPMATGAAKGFLPGVGAAWSYSDWTRQGTGMVTNDLMKAGVSFDTAREIAPLVGAAYAAVEFAQVGQITKLAKGAGGATLKKSIINTALKLLKEKGKDYLHEVGEEGVQQFITDVGTDIGKKIENKSDKDIGKILWDGLKSGGKAALQAAGPMAPYSLAGVGASGIKAGGEAILKKGVEPQTQFKMGEMQFPAGEPKAEWKTLTPEEYAERLKAERAAEKPAEKKKVVVEPDGFKYEVIGDDETAIVPEAVKQPEYTPEEKNVILSSLKESYKDAGLSDEDSDKRSNEVLGKLPREAAKAIHDESVKKEAFRNRLYFDTTTGLKTRSWGEDNGLYKRETSGAELKAVEDKPVIMVDIDHFKTVNDEWGHARGDEVLNAFGLALKTQIDDAGLGSVVRHGGEEIVIFPLQGKEKDVILKLDEIRSSFKERRFAEGNLSGISFSAGVGTGITEADNAVYYAKDQGRDRTEAFVNVPKDFDFNKKNKKKEETHGAVHGAIPDSGVTGGEGEGAAYTGDRRVLRTRRKDEAAEAAASEEAVGIGGRGTPGVDEATRRARKEDIDKGFEFAESSKQAKLTDLDRGRARVEAGSDLRKSLSGTITGDQWKNLLSTKSLDSSGNRIKKTEDVENIFQGLADSWNQAREEGRDSTAAFVPEDVVLNDKSISYWDSESVADLIQEGLNSDDYKKYIRNWESERGAVLDEYERAIDDLDIQLKDLNIGIDEEGDTDFNFGANVGFDDVGAEEVMKPEAKKPEKVEQPEVKKPEAPAPEVKKTEVKEQPETKEQPEVKKPEVKKPEVKEAVERKDVGIGDDFTHNNRKYVLDKIEYDTDIDGASRYSFTFKDITFDKMPIFRAERGSIAGIGNRFGIKIKEESIPEKPKRVREPEAKAPEESKEQEVEKPVEKKPEPKPDEMRPVVGIGDAFEYDGRSYQLESITFDREINGTKKYKFGFKDLSKGTAKRGMPFTRTEVGSIQGMENRFGIKINEESIPGAPVAEKPEVKAPEVKDKERGEEDGKRKEVHDKAAVVGGESEAGKGVEKERPVGEKPERGAGEDEQAGGDAGKVGDVHGAGRGDRVSGFVSSSSSGSDRGARGDELVISPPKTENREVRLIDYLIQESDRIGEGGPVQKTRDNIAAIKILKQIEKDGRYATLEEQRMLVHYVGWGGLSSVFKESGENKFHAELRELLTDEEYTAARRSTLNAHYTSPTVIQAIWKAVTRLGFNGGNVLEPAIGIGHFFGLRPAGIKMGMSGIELDNISGRIAQQLYQNAAIQIKGYQSVKMPADYYQTVISNVPFSDVSPVEPNEFKTPGVPSGSALHDFYFLKSLYGVQPGGLIAFVTTHFTMDKKDPGVRKLITDQADFIGAIRLPSTAFKENAGTEVVTDVIFLQKRAKGVSPSQLNESFLSSVPVMMDKQKGEPGKIEVFVGGYFVNNPDMVIGNQNLSGTMYGANQYNVTLSPGIEKSGFKEMIDAAINRLPENVVGQFKEPSVSKEEDVKVQLENVNDVAALPFGSFFVDKDSVFQKDILNGEIKRYNGYNTAQVKSFVRMKEAMLRLFVEYRAENTSEAKKYLTALEREYEGFVKKYGPLNSKVNEKLFKDDPCVLIVQSIESYDEKTKMATKGALLRGAILHTEKVIEKSDSPIDALIVSLNLFGTVNINHIASMVGKSTAETTDMLLDSGLIFKSPEDFLNGGNTVYLSREEYLSGDVKQKLLTANKAFKKDNSFRQNVEEIKAVQPLDIPFDKIGISLNSPVMSTDDVGDFINTLLETRGTKVLHNPMTGQWSVEVSKNVKSHLLNRDFGTDRRDATKIISDVLKDQKSLVYNTVLDVDGKEKKVLLEKESSEAQIKNDLIKKEFSKWVWDDDDRTKRLVRSFNDRFNAFVNRVYIHPLRVRDPKAVIKFVNSAFPHPALPHQADAVWRIVQSMRVLLAHEVGAGKTLEMVWGAGELKRMGFIKKPMFVFPNHMVKQWTKEYMQAYPSAKILVAQEGDLSKENRKRFINRIATGDWDAVLVKMQDFLSIPLSPAEEMDQIRKIVQGYKTFLKSITSDDHGGKIKKDRTVKELEKKIDKYENKILNLKNRVHKETGTLYFDDLGVDMLLVDEADLFKNLEYFTTLKNVRGLGTMSGSGRAMDLYQKTQYLYKKNGRVVFATGTPISNTLVESYTMMKYLQPEWLHDQGIGSFDDWQRLNASIITEMAPDNTGTSYKLKTMFAKIKNARSLMKALRETWDIKTAKYLEENDILVSGRNLPFKKVINIAAPLTDYMKSFKRYLVKREDDLKGQKPGQKGMDNVLVIIDDGKKAALDMRLFSSSLPDMPESKLNVAVGKITDVYKRYAKQKYTQIVFVDGAKSYRKDKTGKKVVSFDAIKDIVEKLVKNGIRPEEIAVISDPKYDSDKAKAAMFQDMREGKVRILVGSVAKMGAGTNVQDLGKAIHFLDAKWRPRDFWQAIGRFVRQGNSVRDFDENGKDITKEGKKGTVEIYNYATRGSLDTGIWSMLETKARAIENVMGSTENVDYEIEEDFFSTVKDLSIEDPAMKESLGLRYRLKELNNFEDAYIKTKAQLKSEIKNLPAKIESIKESIDKVKKDIGTRKPELKGDDFSITIDGVEYNKKNMSNPVTAAGEAIIKAMEGLAIKAGGNYVVEKKVIGEYGGFKLEINAQLAAKTVWGQFYAVGNYQYGGKYNGSTPLSGLQVVNELSGAVYSRMDNQLKSFQERQAEAESSLAKAKKKVDDPFEFTQEIAEKTARLKEIEVILDEQKKKQSEEPDLLDIDWDSMRDVLPVDLSEGKIFDENGKEVGGEDEGAEPDVVKMKGEKPIKFTEETADMFEGILPAERTPQQIEMEARIKAKKGGKADVEALPLFEGGEGVVAGTEQLSLFSKGEPVRFEKSFAELKGLISPALWDSFDVVISDKFGPGNKYSFGTTKEGRPITKGAVWKDERGFHVVINPLVKSSKEISRILVHEIMGHAGAINVLRTNKPVYKRISDLYRVAKYTPAMEKLREKYAEELEDNPKFAENIIFGEWIAFSMEDYIANPKNRGIAYQVWRAIRQFLIDMGLAADTVEDVMFAIAKDIKGLKEIQAKLTMKPMMQKTEKVAPTFFSPLQKAVSGLKQEKGTGDQMFAMITKTPGVKEAEWKWMGLDDFLKGKQSVTKAEIEEFVRENQVEIKEVEKSKKPRQIPFEEAKIIVNNGGLVRDSGGNYISTVGQINSYGRSSTFTSEKERELKGAKFSKYSLPGGENYREVLLTLPETDLDNIRQKLTAEKLDDGTYQVSIGDRFVGNPIFANSKEDAINRIPLDVISPKTRHQLGVKSSYLSSHWEEPNVIAHIRMNDRTGPNGEKVLFVEEIQSDWAREAREKGIAGANEPTTKQFGISIGGSEPNIFFNTKELAKERIADIKDNYSEPLTIVEVDRIVRTGAKKEGVPGQPFLKNWEELTLKRVLRMAAEEGYDRVAWINGEQTADRYDLSKKVSKIVYRKHKNGKYRVDVIGDDGRPIWTTDNSDVDNISKNVGKDIAQRIQDGVGESENAEQQVANAYKAGRINYLEYKEQLEYLKDNPDAKGAENTVLSGENLKIGGEWAVNLYDRIIPKFYEKYGKKWGTKVEDVNFAKPTSTKDIYEVTAREDYEGDYPYLITKNGKEETYAKSEDDAKRIIGRLKGEIVYKSELGIQQSIPITESMRESVLFEGQPMFQKSEADIPLREQLDQIYAKAAVQKEHPVKKYLGLEKSYQHIKDKVLANNLVPVSTRLKHINPVFKNELRRFESDYRQQEMKDLKAIQPFTDKFKKIPADDQRIFDLAVKNSDKKMVTDIISKYKMEAEYEAVRGILDSIHARAKLAGFSMNYVQEYWPRMLLDYSGLLNYVSDSVEGGIIDKQIEKAQKTMGRPLSEKEKGDIVDKLIARPDRMVQIPGPTQKRTINIIDIEMDRFYDYSVSALIKYIHEMDQSIEIRKFLGMDLQSQAEEKGAVQEAMSFDEMVKDVIDNRINDIEGGIDTYILKAIEDGKLNSQQQDELIGIFKARFNYRPSGNVLQTVKDLGYIGSMGSGFSSFLTQIGDFTWPYYEAGPINATKSLAMAVAGKSVITKEDLGLNRIAEEFRTTRGLGKILQKIFDITLLTKMDNVGKEMLINGLLLKYQQQAQRRDIRLLKTLQELFGFEVGKLVLDDLKNKRITDNVKYMLFTRLLDFQPLALSEMPLSYLKSPNGRIFYMLKTFTIKQLDVFRNESIDVIVQGFKNNDMKMIARGFLNLGYLAALFIAANAGADELKDWLFGRKPSFEDKVYDNIFRLFGLSRYLTYEVRREGPVMAFWKLITPPMDIIEAPLRDAWKLFKDDSKPFSVKLKQAETWKLIPFFGKHYYWWLGGGRVKELKNREKEISPEYVRFLEIAKDAERKRKNYKEMKEDDPQRAAEYKKKNIKVLRLTEMNKETEGGRTTSTINLKQADMRELKEKREKAMERGDMQAVERIDKRITEKSKQFLLYYKNVIGD